MFPIPVKLGWICVATAAAIAMAMSLQGCFTKPREQKDECNSIAVNGNAEEKVCCRTITETRNAMAGSSTYHQILVNEVQIPEDYHVMCCSMTHGFSKFGLACKAALKELKLGSKDADFEAVKALREKSRATWSDEFDASYEKRQKQNTPRGMSQEEFAAFMMKKKTGQEFDANDAKVIYDLLNVAERSTESEETLWAFHWIRFLEEETLMSWSFKAACSSSGKPVANGELSMELSEFTAWVLAFFGIQKPTDSESEAVKRAFAAVAKDRTAVSWDDLHAFLFGFSDSTGTGTGTSEASVLLQTPNYSIKQRLNKFTRRPREYKVAKGFK